MRRLVSGLLIVTMATGCAIGADNDAHRIDLTVASGVLDNPTDADEAPDADTVAVSLFLVRDNLLVHVTREAPLDAAGVVSVVAAAVAGPTAAEARAGMWSAIPPGTVVRGVQQNDGVATLDLTSHLAAIGGTDEILAVAQIVQSVTALPDVDAVMFLLDGAATSVPRADGVLDAGPLTADDYLELAGG